MKRGVIKLTSDELQILNSQLTKLPKLLSQKLIIETSITESKIELSEEDTEILLDLLPMPQADEKKGLVQLRLNLQNFLQSLRSSY